MIGFMDLLESSKDVGQSGIISPWADLSDFSKTDINKYKSIKFDLFMFMQEHFPYDCVTFEANNIVEFNNILDRICAAATCFNLNYKINKNNTEEE